MSNVERTIKMVGEWWPAPEQTSKVDCHSCFSEAGELVDMTCGVCLSAVEYGEQLAEERIIKLLERKADKVLESGAGRPMPQKMEFIAVEHSIRELIALIKGEKSASPLNSEQTNKQYKGENK